MSDTYSTSDFPTAAFIMANGEKMVSTKRDGRRVVFEFGDHAKCRRLAEKYMYGDDMVSARKLHEASKRLKSIIHDVMGEKEGGDA